MGAIEAFENERWNDAVYLFQMAIEQATKAILILYGIEYPRRHDISEHYKILKQQNIPKWFIKKIDYHADKLKELASLRGIAAYGYVDGYKAEDFKTDAMEYKEPVKEIIDDCDKLINEFSKNQKLK